MPYITREDGERFVIPSYRDVISAKKPSLLKREIMLLSTNYGEYITLHRKNVEQYEVAFSPDTGYLLGETVWHYFKRPMDLIYCEAIPNTSEAILVIVKAGSVYLDGSFPIDAIPDELVIFRTQQNNFDVYIYGDIPISKTPEQGMFAFDPSSVRSFQVLDEPAFPKLPKVKNFQLQLVDNVLRSQGIGVLPIKPILTVAVVIILVWMGWSFLATHRKTLPASFVSYVNPYQAFYDTLTSPDPSYQVHKITEAIQLLYTMPGWTFTTLTFDKEKFHINVKSPGVKTDLLLKWAKQRNINVSVQQDGFYLDWQLISPIRPTPQTINKLNEVVGSLVDRLSNVLPGNNLQLGTMVDRKIYMELPITITFGDISPEVLDYIGLQLRNLPLVLNKVSLTSENGDLSGSIVLQALGN